MFCGEMKVLKGAESCQKGGDGRGTNGQTDVVMEELINFAMVAYPRQLVYPGTHNTTGSRNTSARPARAHGNRCLLPTGRKLVDGMGRRKVYSLGR